MTVAVLVPVVAAAVLGGAAAGLLGCLVVGLRLPFVAVFTAHAALAGAVFATLAGVPARAGALAGAAVGSVALGVILRRWEVEPEIALGSLFSLMLGLAFVGIGLVRGPRTELLGLMWGSLLFVGRSQLAWLAVSLAAVVALVVAVCRELGLLIVSRELAALQSRGDLLLIGVLLIAALVIAVNLETVGGLMIYSLVANPAVVAVRTARSFQGALVVSALVGAACALVGFGVAWWLDLPVGASIVLLSSLVVGAVEGWRWLHR